MFRSWFWRSRSSLARALRFMSLVLGATVIFTATQPSHQQSPKDGGIPEGEIAWDADTVRTPTAPRALPLPPPPHGLPSWLHGSLCLRGGEKRKEKGVYHGAGGGGGVPVAPPNRATPTPPHQKDGVRSRSPPMAVTATGGGCHAASPAGGRWRGGRAAGRRRPQVQAWPCPRPPPTHIHTHIRCCGHIFATLLGRGGAQCELWSVWSEGMFSWSPLADSLIHAPIS